MLVWSSVSLHMHTVVAALSAYIAVSSAYMLLPALEYSALINILYNVCGRSGPRLDYRETLIKKQMRNNIFM